MATAGKLVREETGWYRGHNRSLGQALAFDIQTFNAIAPEGLANFPDDYKVSPSLTDPHAILLRSHKLQVEEVPKSVRAIARCGAGTNNIPVADMTRRGIPVFNTPGANANAVKELVLCSMLLSSRGIYEGHMHMKNIWEEESDPAVVAKRVEKEKKFFRGQELAGKTLGVIGLGHIGREVAKAAVALGMNVVGFDPAITVDTAWQLPNQVVKAAKLDDLLPAVDYVTLHAPYIKGEGGTHHLLGAHNLELLKSTANILNFARDELIDSEALKARYDSGDFTGKYVCDFPIPVLHDKGYPVVMVPHLGASTEEAEINSATMGAREITDFLEQGIVRNSVNFPNCVPPNLAPGEDQVTRLTVVNTNTTGVLAALTTVLGEFQCNILQNINVSRGDIAYNVIDMSGFPENPRDLQVAISKVDGILTSRILAGNPGTYYYVEGTFV